MIKLFVALGGFLGKIFAAILPAILKQGRQPRDVKPAGFDKELQKDINESIEDSADGTD